ncbi:hypothetical protein LguiB_031815 [Lonicera macranthoides]
MEEFPDLSNLKKLVKLQICGCHDLAEIRGLEELKSLKSLDITSCSSIEHTSDSTSSADPDDEPQSLGTWPRTTDPEDSEALVHVSSEWGVAQGLGSPSRSFGDNPQDIFPGMTLRIVNEENTSYKPHRHSRKNYTRRYPSRVMTISSPTTSRETHHWESSGTRDLLHCRGNLFNREHLVLSEGKIPRVGSPLWATQPAAESPISFSRARFRACSPMGGNRRPSFESRGATRCSGHHSVWKVENQEMQPAYYLLNWQRRRQE